MNAPLRISDDAPSSAEIETLYAGAFPDEPPSLLVGDLLALGTVRSLTARSEGALIGHVLFTPCDLDNGGRVALLGPLAVAPGLQRRGVGGSLIRAGLARLNDSEASHVLVLGDPAYYARFGFEPEFAIRPAHPIPQAWAEAWRSIALKPVDASGRLIPPPPWDDPALWR